MKPYPAYKDSGIEWIKEIPNHWKLSKIKYFIEAIGDGGTPSRSNPDYFDGEINWLVVDDIQDEIYKTKETITELGYINSSAKLWDVDDVIISLGASIGEVGIAKVPLTTKQGVAGIKVDKSKILPKYLFYVLKIGKPIFNGLATGTTIFEFRPPRLKEMCHQLPLLPEQKQIISFLDRKTQQIDELIEKTEQKIELLKEKRTSLIDHCVTKGLNPNVEMKDSGMKWLGNIPKHWEVIKLRFFGELQNGISKDSDSFGSGYPFLGYGDVYNNETIPTKVEGLVNSTEVEREKCSVEEGDVFFTRTSETMEEIGIPSTCMETIQNCVFSGFVIRFRNTSKVLTKGFSKYYFPSHFPRAFLVNEMNIVTRSSLSQELLKRLPVLLPSLDEQQQIVEYLDTKTQEIDSTIEKEIQRIELSKEYRQSLISEVVTGKIDVRDEVVV